MQRRVEPLIRGPKGHLDRVPVALHLTDVHLHRHRVHEAGAIPVVEPLVGRAERVVLGPVGFVVGRDREVVVHVVDRVRVLVPDLPTGHPAVLAVAHDPESVRIRQDNLDLAIPIYVHGQRVLPTGAAVVGGLLHAHRPVDPGIDPKVVLAGVDHLGVAIPFKVVDT